MLQIGVNPDGFGDSGMTALHAAAWRGHIDMVRLLLDSGAHVQLRDTMFGNSPLESARHGVKHSRKSLEEFEAIFNLLRQAEG
jgi:ankyrin repeat protein